MALLVGLADVVGALVWLLVCCLCGGRCGYHLSGPIEMVWSLLAVDLEEGV